MWPLAQNVLGVQALTSDWKCIQFTAIGNALATPPTASAIVGAELLGIFAFFALQRLVAAERAGDMEI